jgi:hypothetical protein
VSANPSFSFSSIFPNSLSIWFNRGII